MNDTNNQTEDFNEQSFVLKIDLDQFFVARFTRDQDLFGRLIEIMKAR